MYSLKLLGVTIEFEFQLTNMARLVSSKLGILRKCKKSYGGNFTCRCFFYLILSHFEYFMYGYLLRSYAQDRIIALLIV